MNKLFFSIVIPCYNSEKSISTVIDQIIKENRSLEDFELKEIICVNDYSQDNTQDVILNLKKKNKFVTLVSNKKNLGQVGSTIEGIKVASSDYIVTLDDDGQHPPSEIVKLLKKCSRGNHDFVSGYWKNDETRIRNISSIIANFLISVSIFKSPKFRLTAFRVINKSIKSQIINKFHKSLIMDLRKITKNFSTLQVNHNSNPLNRKFSNFLFRFKITFLYLIKETFFLIIFFAINVFLLFFI